VNALAVLRDDGLIETRQGSGSFVTASPAGDIERQTRADGHSEEFRVISDQLKEIRQHMRTLSSRLDALEAQTPPDQGER
jgi:DNA-binding FadR family transcriptional regulator